MNWLKSFISRIRLAREAERLANFCISSKSDKMLLMKLDMTPKDVVSLSMSSMWTIWVNESFGTSATFVHVSPLCWASAFASAKVVSKFISLHHDDFKNVRFANRVKRLEGWKHEWSPVTMCAERGMIDEAYLMIEKGFLLTDLEWDFVMSKAQKEGVVWMSKFSTIKEVTTLREKGVNQSVAPKRTTGAL